MRSHINRIIIVITLLAVLPAIAVGERARPGTGRRLAVNTIRRVARLCGIRFEVSGSDKLDDAAPRSLRRIG